ncbi:App1 family protein [Plantibacter sp. Mn2098]|uniref:App1 family protein n=1 Tax=Plantibacter sp. Mn2098 TaxID=3395266 RepID=UPI003BDC82A2
MKAPERPESGSDAGAQIRHRAARIEDAVQLWRQRRARKRGRVATVIPFTGYGSPEWIRVLARVVLTHPGAEGTRPQQKVRGWRSFFALSVTDPVVNVTVDIGGASHTVTGDRGGIVDVVIPASLEPGWHTVSLSAEGSEPITAPIFIIGEDVRFGTISDVDDTVMVTALPRPLVAAWNTFVLDEHARTPVPGMAVFLERTVRDHPGSPVIYLSTGAWNVAPTLTRFLSRNLYPAGALLLTDWGPTHDRWFRSGRQHKRTNLARLAEEFPNVKWLLVGDDGQHDESLYREFEHAHPDRVSAVAIRQLSAGEAVLAGGRSRAGADEDDEAPWVYAPNGAGLLDQLADKL